LQNYGHLLDYYNKRLNMFKKKLNICYHMKTVPILIDVSFILF